MFAEERKREIIKLLHTQGKVKTLALAELFEVSEPTIRRDINEMEEQGLLIRTHGGAIAMDTAEKEPSFVEKSDRLQSEKEQIGRVAASMIHDGDTVVMDTGTTTLMIARHMRAENVTVVTNSLDIAYELESKPNVEILITGGVIRWNTRAMVGPVAESALDRFRVDLAFIGANAVSIENGLTTPNIGEADIKRKMIKVARKTFLVMDHTKFDRTTFSRIADLSEISGIITDPGVDEDIIRRYEQADVSIILKAGGTRDHYSNSESGSRPNNHPE